MKHTFFFCCRYLVQKSVTVNTDAAIFVALDRSITKLINVRASEVFPGMVRHKTKHMLTNGNKNCSASRFRIVRFSTNDFKPIYYVQLLRK